MALQSRASMTERRVGLRMLSEYLHLSTATISVVLNSAPGAERISSKTKARIVQAADLFGYRPSFLARSLRKGRSSTVGIVLPELGYPHTSEILVGVEEVLVKEGYFYLTASHRHKAYLMEQYPLMLRERSVEGLILVDSSLEKGFNLPIVAIAGPGPVVGATNIALDDRQAAELIIRHLYQLGHRKIAFMRGGGDSSDTNNRWGHFVAVARDLELSVPAEVTVGLCPQISTPGLGFEGARELLRRSRDFTAIVCYDDVSAIGAIRACYDHGLQVPADISIVGFDDIPAAAYHSPSLTTIRQPLTHMGEIAAGVLLHKIRGLETVPDAFAIRPELVIRESTSPSRHRRSGKRCQ